eukprot:1846-Eustigmatos_ZCMA.PRE.1
MRTTIALVLTAITYAPSTSTSVSATTVPTASLRGAGNNNMTHVRVGPEFGQWYSVDSGVGEWCHDT